jgi:ferredoxin
MKATVDETKCVGCGLCAETCPNVFIMSNGLAKVTVQAVKLQDAADCHKAADECPVEAIGIEE